MHLEYNINPLKLDGKMGVKIFYKKIYSFLFQLYNSNNIIYNIFLKQKEVAIKTINEYSTARLLIHPFYRSTRARNVNPRESHF